jgi:glycerol-3-phosphate dehydrogenase
VAAFLKDAAEAFPWAELRTEDMVLVHHGFVPGTGGARLWPHDEVIEPDHSRASGLLALVASKSTTARALAEKAVSRAFDHLGRPRVASRSAQTPLPVPDPDATLEEQIRRAVQEELAVHLSDVVYRRTELGSAGVPARLVTERVAQLMAPYRGWSREEIESEIRALG